MGMSDLISRQAAIEEILGCCPSDPFGSEYECGYDDGLRQGVHRIKHLPTIDAVPVKHGEWVGVMTEAWCTFDECKCSVCGVVEYFNKGWKKFNYCPNCGADMRERKDDEEQVQGSPDRHA